MKHSPQTLLPPANLVLLGLLLAVCLLGGLSQVWVQRQIGRTAAQIERHEVALRDLERKNRYMDGLLAEAHRPDELIRRGGGNLRLPEWDQIVRVRRSYDSDGNRVVELLPYSNPTEVASNY